MYFGSDFLSSLFLCFSFSFQILNHEEEMIYCLFFTSQYLLQSFFVSSSRRLDHPSVKLLRKEQKKLFSFNFVLLGENMNLLRI